MKVESISRFKKEGFLLRLSEDEFRDKVVRPLFLRSGYSDGRDLCGPFEHGKDTIFLETDKLGLQTVIAVQTKKGSMNPASKSSQNLVNAITQLKTALETTITITVTRSKLKPNKVILCASGKINDAARGHILEEVRTPNIQFLDAEDLIPRIDSLLPELWLGIEANILPYFQAVQRYVLGEPQTDQTQDGVLASAVDDAVFVGLNLYRTAVKKKKFRGKTIETPVLEEFPLSAVTNKQGRRILIVGEAGSGKSTGLMRIALETVRRGIEKEEKYRVPVLLRATELARHKPSDLVSHCDEITKQLSHTNKSCFTLDDLSGGRVALLVDGLDEIADDDERAEVGRILVRFSSLYPKCQVIATSRPYKFLSELKEFRSFEEYRISPIRWKQAEKIVNRITEKKRVPKAQSQELLRRLEKIHGIELNPLLVTVFAATTDFTKQDIPANITELFKKFTELMLGRWDERKGLKHQYQAPLKDFVLTKIAFYMHNQKQTSIPRAWAENIAREVLKTRGYVDADAEQLLGEIFDRSGLFRVAGSEIEFRHHLLQEFFAGRGIDSTEFVTTAIVEEWWKRALVFYFGANPDRIELLRSTSLAISSVEPEKLIQAATTVGLALQACYLSPVAEKLDSWKWVVKALGSCQDVFLREGDPEGKYPISEFITFYLYARDSVALWHLKQHVNALVQWAIADDDLGKSSDEERSLFWLLVGLIESGEISEAESILKKIKFHDGRCLAAISLGCHMANEIRPLDKSEKEKARQIATKLQSKTAPYIEKLVSEFGSMLLELRKGDVKAIDDEVDPSAEGAPYNLVK